MTKKLSSATSLLVGGLMLFTLGLFLIVHQNPVFGLFSQVIPDTQETLLFGVVVQFLGQALVIFGAMRSASHKLISNIQSERQITIASIAQNMQQLHAEQQALKTGYVQTMAKLDTLIAKQSAATTPQELLMPSNCKFCKAQIAQGHFCPQCGKAN